MSINQDPAAPEQASIVSQDPSIEAPVLGEAPAAPTELEGEQELLMAEPPAEPMIAPEGEQQAGLGRVFREIGESVGGAIKGSPRAPRPTAGQQAAQDIEGMMERVGDFTDPAAVDVTRWNSEYIDDVEDINAILQGGHDFFNFEQTHEALKVQSHVETLQKARAMSDEDFANTVLNYKPGEAWNAEKIQRGRMMMVSLAEEIYSYAGKIGEEVTEASGRKQWKLTTQNEDELFELHRKLNVLAAVQYATEGAISEAGRALNSMKIKVGSTMMDQSNLHEKYARVGGIKSTEKLLNMVMNGDFADMAKTAKHVKGNRLWNLTKDLWYFGMLSGVSTHEKNVIGNTIVNLNGVQEKYMQAVWGKVFDATGANKLYKGWGVTPDERVRLDEANNFAIGNISGWILAFKMLGRRIKEGSKQMVSDATGGRVFPDGGLAPEKVDVGHVAYDDANRMRGFSAENLGVDPKSNQGKALNFVGDWIVGAPGNALGTMDDFFKTIAYEQSIMEVSLRRARAELGDDFNDPDKLYPFLQQLRENPPKDMHESAIAFARQQTFTEDLDSAVGKWVMQGQSVPIVNAFVPFVRTVSNIMRYGVDRTPVLGQLPFVTSFWKDIRAGGQARDAAMARLTTGAMMAGIANIMYLGESKEVTDPATGQKTEIHMPRFTGRGSSNYEVRKLMQQAGWQPYSIFNPETGAYEPYDYIEPFGTMLGTVATALEVLHNTYDEEKRQDIMSALVMGLAEYTLDKSYMQGYADLLDIMQGDKSFTKWASKFASTIAMPAVVKNARKDMDPYMRGSDAGGVLDIFLREFQNRTPWLSENVPPYVDMWGDDMRYGNPIWKYHYISPGMSRTITSDPITREIAKLYKPNQEDAKRFSMRTPSPVIPWRVQTPTGRTVEVKVDLREVDPTGWAYHDWQSLVGKERRKLAEKMIGRGGWDTANEQQKYVQMSTVFNNGADIAKAQVVYDKRHTDASRAFRQKYSDAIQLEAERILSVQMNLQPGQYDYLPAPEDQGGAAKQPRF